MFLAEVQPLRVYNVVSKCCTTLRAVSCLEDGEFSQPDCGFQLKNHSFPRRTFKNIPIVVLQISGALLGCFLKNQINRALVTQNLFFSLMSLPITQADVIERSYVHAELEGLNRSELIELVERQIMKWPAHRGQPFHRSRVRVKELKEALLNPANGFTTNLPFGSIANLQKRRRGRATQNASPALNRDGGLPQESLNSNTNASQSTPLLSSSVYLPTVHRSTPATPTPSPTLTLKLLINDTRYQPEGLRRSQIITVPYSIRSECGSNEYTVLFSDVFDRLQLTNTALEGTGELTSCDPDEPEYGHVLMKGDFGATAPSTESLFIPASKKLKLNITPYLSLASTPVRKFAASGVEKLSQDSNANASGSSLLISRASKQSLTQVLSDPNSIPLRFADTFYGPKKGPKELMIKELTNEASKSPGYDTFISNRHRVLPYHEVVAHWTFIATFSNAHFRNKCPVTNNVKSKTAIAQALGIRTTSLSAAEQGYRLIQIYGPDGSDEAPEVVAEVASGKTGAVALMDFLIHWKETHPVNE
ncbi:hypothetical protein FB446DRAFT_50235 [Lentinula raphanica]|nr:hypothetical protein FB446DRAFT_50235 [Lentinula raphanica]